MRRSVFAFWQLPEDEHAFLQFLHEDGAKALLDRWYAVDEELRPFAVPECSRAGKGAYLFARAEFLPTLVRYPVPRNEDRYYCVCATTSCVLSYRRGAKVGKQLFLSNVNYCTAYWDQHDEWTKKPGDFLSWARKVRKWLRARASGERRLRTACYPATPAVIAAVEKGRIQLSI